MKIITKTKSPGLILNHPVWQTLTPGKCSKGTLQVIARFITIFSGISAPQGPFLLNSSGQAF
jgi:hypothetical protein